ANRFVTLPSIRTDQARRCSTCPDTTSTGRTDMYWQSPNGCPLARRFVARPSSTTRKETRRIRTPMPQFARGAKVPMKCSTVITKLHSRIRIERKSLPLNHLQYHGRWASFWESHYPPALACFYGPVALALPAPIDTNGWPLRVFF